MKPATTPRHLTPGCEGRAARRLREQCMCMHTTRHRSFFFIMIPFVFTFPANLVRPSLFHSKAAIISEEVLRALGESDVHHWDIHGKRRPSGMRQPVRRRLWSAGGGVCCRKREVAVGVAGREGHKHRGSTRVTHVRGTAVRALWTLSIRCDSRLRVASGFLCTARRFLPFVTASL